MAGFFRLVRGLAEARAIAIGEPQIDHGCQGYEQLRSGPNLPGDHTKDPGERKERSEDTNEPGREIFICFSPCHEWAWTNARLQILSHGGETFAKEETVSEFDRGCLTGADLFWRGRREQPSSQG